MSDFGAVLDGKTKSRIADVGEI